MVWMSATEGRPEASPTSSKQPALTLDRAGRVHLARGRVHLVRGRERLMLGRVVRQGRCQRCREDLSVADSRSRPCSLALVASCQADLLRMAAAAARPGKAFLWEGTGRRRVCRVGAPACRVRGRVLAPSQGLGLVLPTQAAEGQVDSFHNL
jgi:hypothetical protein